MMRTVKSKEYVALESGPEKVNDSTARDLCKLTQLIGKTLTFAAVSTGGAD
jgi:hypothetical protein